MREEKNARRLNSRDRRVRIHFGGIKETSQWDREASFARGSKRRKAAPPTNPLLAKTLGYTANFRLLKLNVGILSLRKLHPIRELFEIRGENFYPLPARFPLAVSSVAREFNQIEPRSYIPSPGSVARGLFRRFFEALLYPRYIL